MPYEINPLMDLRIVVGFQGEKIGERKFGKTSTGQSAGWHNNNVAKTSLASFSIKICGMVLPSLVFIA